MDTIAHKRKKHKSVVVRLAALLIYSPQPSGTSA